MSEEIRCNLIENAIDYLLFAGEMATDGCPRMLKHAIATLADGVELMLKARLESEDWKLLFRNQEEASLESLKRGDFRSVGFDESVERLRQDCGVDIIKSAVPKSLRDSRNQIRHFAITTNREQAVSIIAKTYSFALDFISEERLVESEGAAGADLVKLRDLLITFEEFIAIRLREAAVPSGYACTECPVCLQKMLYSECEVVQCAFCTYKDDPDSAAVAWVNRNFGFRSPKDQLIDPGIEECPLCYGPAIPLQSKDGCHCLACGEQSVRTGCAICGVATYHRFCDYHQSRRGKEH